MVKKVTGIVQYTDTVMYELSHTHTHTHTLHAHIGRSMFFLGHVLSPGAALCGDGGRYIARERQLFERREATEEREKETNPAFLAADAPLSFPYFISLSLSLFLTKHAIRSGRKCTMQPVHIW